MLFSRVRDDTTRELIDKLKTRAVEATNSKTPQDSERATSEMTAINDTLNQRIGEVLRKLDDADQGNFT
jgi:hypothetical protein